MPGPRPLRVRRMRLEPATDEDRAWLRSSLDRISDSVHITLEPDGALALLHPAAAHGTTGTEPGR